MLVLIAITAILLIIGYVNDNPVCKTVGWIFVVLIELFGTLIEKSLGKISATIKAKVEEKKADENNVDEHNDDENIIDIE